MGVSQEGGGDRPVCPMRGGATSRRVAGRKTPPGGACHLANFIIRQNGGEGGGEEPGSHVVSVPGYSLMLGFLRFQTSHRSELLEAQW